MANFKNILIVLFLFLSVSSYAKEEKKLTIYNANDVVKHNTKESCWMVINEFVYDATSFLEKHPAPLPILLNCCGKDCTKGYADKGIGKPHSETSDAMLEALKIGILKEKMKK